MTFRMEVEVARIAYRLSVIVQSIAVGWRFYPTDPTRRAIVDNAMILSGRNALPAGSMSHYPRYLASQYPGEPGK